MKNGKKGTGGFTLVELIVVIAILAILAGVGTVAYSGYVKKANQAADNVLLSAVNTALSSACTEENKNPRDLNDASLSISAAGTGTLTVDPENAQISAAFAKYFAGNEATPWKYYTALVFVKEDGVFVGVGPNDSAVLSAIINSIQRAVAGSSYAEREADIISDIQALTDAVETVYGTLNAEALSALLGGGFGTYLEAQGVDMNDAQAVANHATMFLANQVSTLTDEQKDAIATIWKSNSFNYPSSIMDGVKAYMDESTGLSTMGAMALYYANAEACIQNLDKNYNPAGETELAQKQAVINAFKGISTQMASSSDINDIWNALSDGYTNMVNAANGNNELLAMIMGYGSSNGDTDAEAFINTMTTISQNADSFEELTGSDNMYGDLAGLLGGN